MLTAVLSSPFPTRSTSIGRAACHSMHAPECMCPSALSDISDHIKPIALVCSTCAVHINPVFVRGGASLLSPTPPCRLLTIKQNGSQNLLFSETSRQVHRWLSKPSSLSALPGRVSSPPCHCRRQGLPLPSLPKWLTNRQTISQTHNCTPMWKRTS